MYYKMDIDQLWKFYDDCSDEEYSDTNSDISIPDDFKFPVPYTGGSPTSRLGSSEFEGTDFPLNGYEVQQIVGHPIGFSLFSQIADKELDDLFINDCCLINYLNQPTMGHWCCITRKCNVDGLDTITYFNPSGKFIDDTIRGMSDFKFISNQYYPHLLKKLLDSDYNVRYMDHKLQDDKTNTCGRWCALFMRFKDLGEEDFIDVFKDIPNETIVKYTDDIIKETGSKPKPFESI